MQEIGIVVEGLAADSEDRSITPKLLRILDEETTFLRLGIMKAYNLWNLLHQRKYPESKMTIAFSNQYDRTFESLVLDLLEPDGN